MNLNSRNAFENLKKFVNNKQNCQLTQENQPIEDKPLIREPKQTFQVNFTVHELIHLRDLLSINLPNELSTTISQDLAQHEGRQYTEAQLWQKIGKACETANIAIGDGAPDFTLGLTGIPQIRVIEISPEPLQQYVEEENTPE